MITLPTMKCLLLRARSTLQRPGFLVILGRSLQLLNSVFLSTVLVRRFGLSMVGTYAIGYVAVAFVPHFLSLGLNSHLPRMQRKLAELVYVAAAVQLAMLGPVILALYYYAKLFSASSGESATVFLVTLTGCATGIFNVGLTLSIISRHFRLALLAPLLESALMVAGALNARSGHDLAWYVLIGKAASVVVIWPRSRFSVVPASEIAAVMKRGTQYLFLDVIGTLNEQISTAFVGFSASRSDLGLYRICQQTLTAAETPGWSYVQSQYPELATGANRSARRILANTFRFGSLAAVAFLVGAFPLAFIAFGVPVLASMLATLSPGLFCRYIIHLCDQRLRATGSIGSAVSLSGLRLLVTGLTICSLVPLFGVWAAIWTTTVLSVAFSIPYTRAAGLHGVPLRQLEPNTTLQTG